MKTRHVRIWSLIVSVLWLCAGAYQPTAAPAPETLAADEQFEAAVEAFYWASWDAQPHSGVRLGYHQYDGKLPNVSAQALQQEQVRLERALQTFERLERGQLSALHQLEREVLLFHIRTALFQLKTLRAPWRNPMFYNQPLDVSPYITRDYKPLANRARAIIAVGEGIGQFLQDAQTNLEPAIPRPWLETALLQVNGTMTFIQNDVKQAFAALTDSVLAKEVEAALGKMTMALEEYKTFLEARQAHTTQAYALGANTFRRMLTETQGVELSLEHLEAIAQADLERNLSAIQAAAHSIDASKSTREVVSLVLADKPPPNGVLDEAQRQATEMRQFLIDHDIVTIPSDDRAEVRVTPPFMRWNFAFLNGPGPFETKTLPSFYYISPPNPQWSEEAQRAYVPGKTDLLATTIHEVWPGHFLHFLHAKRLDSRILKSFGNYATIEGWAHYTEEMMWQAGVGRGDPRVHIGQLCNALLRNVRFLSAIGLHAKGMSVEESQKRFEEQAFRDPGNAQQQAVRGTFDPMYLSYTLGKLMIRKLHTDWKAKMGAAYSLKAFHDTFLSRGLAPIPVIRQAMLGDAAGPVL